MKTVRRSIPYARPKASTLNMARKYGILEVPNRGLTLGVPWQDETTAIVDEMVNNPGTVLIQWMNALVWYMKDRDLWGRSNVFAPLCYKTDSDGDNLINWKNPTGPRLLRNGTLTFEPWAGFVGDGVSGYLNTQFNPSTYDPATGNLSDFRNNIQSNGDFAANNGSIGNNWTMTVGTPSIVTGNGFTGVAQRGESNGGATQSAILYSAKVAGESWVRMRFKYRSNVNLYVGNGINITSPPNIGDAIQVDEVVPVTYDGSINYRFYIANNPANWYEVSDVEIYPYGGWILNQTSLNIYKFKDGGSNVPVQLHGVRSNSVETGIIIPVTRHSGNLCYYGMNNAGIGFTVTGNRMGHNGATRRSATDGSLYLDGQGFYSNASYPHAIVDGEIYFMGRNNNGVPDNFVNDGNSFCQIGGAMTDKNMEDMAHGMDQYLIAIKGLT